MTKVAKGVMNGLAMRLRCLRLAMMRSVPILLVLGACGELPPEVEVDDEEVGDETGTLGHYAYIHELTNDDAHTRTNAASHVGTGAVDIVHELGEMVIIRAGRPGHDSVATGESFATDDGQTFWVRARAPTLNSDDPDATVGGIAGVVLWWRFRKDSPDASLRFVVSEIFLEMVDDNSGPITKIICPWGGDVPDDMLPEVCREVLNATIEAEYHVNVIDDFDGEATWIPLFRSSGQLSLSGYANNLGHRARIGPGYDRTLGVRRLFFATDQFDWVQVDNLPRDRYLRLKSPITLEVPLDTLALGTVLEVYVRSEARVWSRRRNESFVSAYFRDPAGSGGGPAVEFTGLTMLEAPSEPPEPLPIPAAPACEAGGASGAIQFDSLNYYKPEWPGDEGHVAEITVTRTGEGGEASVLFTTSGGTATPGPRDTPGSDYEPVTTNVWFGSGETGTRAVYVPIIGDQEAEGDETVMLTLSDPSGCTGLGDRTNATLTIWDDDEGGLGEDAYTIGGMVTGLDGNGLVLTNNSTDDLEITEDGPFEFDREYATGVIYNVRVDTQPSDPDQFCTVTNGNGTVASENITDIEVDCETLPPPIGNLDPDFGAGGKVTLTVNYTGVQGDAPDVALQDDGKIVVVSGNTLARYNADGSLDVGFGAGGVVTVDFYGSRDRLNAVGVQSDGRIVVAGYSQDGVNSPTQDDIIVARYNADGTLDASFGTGGEVVTDFESHADAAYDLLIQPDGKIVVTGLAATIDDGGFGVYHPDFAAVRYTTDGELDSSFGTGGRVTTNIAGDTDFSYGAALQSDGKIVLAGRVAPSGGANPDIGVVRYNPDGSLDASFGNGGILRNLTDIWDEAADVVVQPDGKIMVVGFTLHEGGIGNPAPDTLTIERYEVDGSYDATFGDNGRVQTPLMVPGRAIALQQDGAIVVAGVEQSGASADYAVARFTPNGELDTGFGVDGLIQVDFFGDLDIANALVLQPDGKVVVAGSVRNGATNQLGIIRVIP